MINHHSKIFLAGHKGMLGSSILRTFKKKGYKNLIIIDKKKLDLRDQQSVKKFFRKKKPHAVIIAAAKVGGIRANMNYPANFINDNLQIQTNLISASYENKVKKLILFGSSCIYPKNLKKSIKENQILSGKLEETNESYAVAKIAGVKLIEAFNKQYNTNYICLMPCNLFGPNDNYDLKNSHFFPALIRKAHTCKVKNKKFIEIWGTGNPLRELIYVDDIADACIFFMRKKTRDTLINIGTGKDYRIKDYVNFILKKLDLKIKIKYNKSKPDGVLRKLLDVSKARKYGWTAKTSLDDGFKKTYSEFEKSFIK